MATFRSSVLVAIIFANLACVRAADTPESPPAGARGPQPSVTTQPSIEHVSPRRDSVGPQPKAFEWTAVSGAEGYALLLVNEIDIEQWEVTVQGTSVDLPQELVLDSGTYYWAVGAFLGGRQVAYSGRSAFVVLK